MRSPRAALSHAAALASLALVTLVPRLALAVPTLDAKNAQGDRARYVAGWNEVVVTLRNADLPAWSGELIVDAGIGMSAADKPLVRVPVSVGAGEGASRFHLPFYVHPGSVPAVRLRNSAEGVVASRVLDAVSPPETVASIVEIHNPAFGEKLREIPAPSTSPKRGESTSPLSDGPYAPDNGTHAAPTPSPGRYRRAPAPAPATTSFGTNPVPDVITAEFAKETGDPILPEVAVGWSGAALVVSSSDVLARLPPRALDSLDQWVVSGGILAISVAREEDLRTPALEQLLGTKARVTGNNGDARSFAGEGLERRDESAKGDDGDAIAHGRGETWLLRYDPWKKTSDAEQPKTIYALWQRALQFKRPIAMAGPAGLPPRWFDDDRARAYLDPNHTFRPALTIAAGLVALYAILVGPVAFARARRTGKPLSVLRWTPVLALFLFVALVGLGKVGKGLRGRVRKLAIVDAAGGATKARGTTFHAFYVGDPSTLELTTQKPIDAVHVAEPFSDDVAIDLDRNGMAVRSVRAHPWETVVVVEESSRDLGGGVILEGVGSRFSLTNKTPWTLEHVILHPETTFTEPARSHYFAKVEPGQTVIARDGIAVDRVILPASLRLLPGAKAEDARLRADRDASEALEALDLLTGAWQGSTSPAGHVLPAIDPVATALVTMPKSSESGFSVERDTVLLRVLGLGGGKGKGELPSDEPKRREREL